MVDKPKSGRCGVFLQCGRGRCDETRQALTFRVPISTCRALGSDTALFPSSGHFALLPHTQARAPTFWVSTAPRPLHVAQQVADMPTTHVLVALSSVAFTAASGHTLRAIRERRDPAYARRVRARRQTGVATRRTPNARGASVTPHASPEIEALRACPPWHEEGSPEERVVQLGLELDGRIATNPAGVFRPAVVVGDLAYVSGQVPRNTDGSLIVGKCGTETMTEEQAVEAARVVGITMLATMRQQFGSLDHVRQVVKVNGFVNCESDFTKQPAVVNGLANLLIEVFGPAGKASRSAIGCSGLPLGIPVEAEAIVELVK